MKTLLYFLHLLSIRPKWAILALAMYGAYQILCLAMVGCNSRFGPKVR
jgi:hypothetical protein